MNPHFASLFFLVPLLAAFVHSSASDGCPDGYELGVDAFGDPKCTSTRIQCPLPGESRRYFDQTLNRQRCCPAKDTLTLFDNDKKNGICCPAETPYQSDSSGGAFCTVGQVYRGGKCQESAPPPPPPPPPPSPPPPPPPPSCTPPTCKGECGLNLACGDDKSIGLTYGLCYVIAFPDGKQLGRRFHDRVYVKDGGIQDIPFKVCKDPSSCSTGPVLATDQFYLQDQLGDIKDVDGVPGYVSQGGRGARLSFTTLKSEAGQFMGTTSCANGECAVQIFGGAELGGFGLTDGCTSDATGIAYWDNPKVGLKTRFSEVPCDGDYPAWRAAKNAAAAA